MPDAVTPAPDPVADKAAALRFIAEDKAARLARFQALSIEASKSTGFRFDAEPLAAIAPDGTLRYGARVVIVEASE